MEVIIDPKSGFCFGVKRAIEMAEAEVKQDKQLYCLGEIVHNAEEVARMEKQGIRFIDRNTFFTLSNSRVLIRAHGEPPETYHYALENNIEIIDATCPVVLKLQDRVRIAQEGSEPMQVVIYGKPDHPEVVGLKGQVDDAIIVQSLNDVQQLSLEKPIRLFAQTTKDKATYSKMQACLEQRIKEVNLSEDYLKVNHSICGQVANRSPWLAEFCQTVDTLIFVGGKNSSNSKVLFEVCKQHNSNSYFVTSVADMANIPLPQDGKVGISGATSTPSWLIDEVAEKAQQQAD